NSGGNLTKLTAAPIATDSSTGDGSAWADYDNDGDLDLFVTNAGSGNSLYRNNGDGSLTKLTNTVVALDRKTSTSCAWGDYDNDGYVDLFVANGIDNSENNFLYHNNGDG